MVEAVGAGGVLRVVVDGRCEEAGAVVVLPRLGESVWLARGCRGAVGGAVGGSAGAAAGRRRAG